MADYNINNTQDVNIDNPFKQQGQVFIGDVLMSYLDHNGIPQSLSLHTLNGDDSQLVIPSGVFKQVREYVVSLQDNGVGTAVKKTLNVTGIVSSNSTTNNCSGTCGTCGTCQDSCGCSSSHTSSKQVETVVKTEVEKTQVENVKQHNLIAERINCVEKAANDAHLVMSTNNEKLDTYVKQADNLKNDILTEAKDLFRELSTDFNNIKYIKDELPSYRSIKDDIEDYKRLRNSVEEERLIKYESFEKDLQNSLDSYTSLKKEIQSMKLGDSQLEIYNKNIETLSKQVNGFEDVVNQSYQEVLNQFNKEVTEVHTFGSDLKNNISKTDGLKTDLANANKEFNKYKRYLNVELTKIESDVKNLDFSTEVKSLTEDVENLLDCCDDMKAFKESVDLRLCDIEGDIKELKKFKNAYEPMLLKMKQAGFDSLNDTG